MKPQKTVFFLVVRPLRGGAGKGLATKKKAVSEALKKNSGKFFGATKLELGRVRP